MMIDIDPEFRRLDRSHGCSESILNRSVERYRNIDIFRLGRRSGEQVRARKEAVFIDHAFLVPNPDVLAQLPQRNPERQLTPERVSVRANVAEYSERLMFSQSPADLVEFLAHSRFSLSAS